MEYRISTADPNKHLLDIELCITDLDREELELQMPFWRPGRYREAEFARNVMKLLAYDQDGNPLEVNKLRKDRWKLNCNGVSEVKLHYRYYAHEMTAGASYVDGEQLYINPVSALIYAPAFEEREHRVELEIPDDHILATALQVREGKTLIAPDLQALMDGPFIASPYLKHQAFDCEGVRFHVWFQGECKPDRDRIERDFKAFIQEQVQAFGHFPTDTYHFLFQVLPYRTFHGVEHCDSTVIVLGPSPRIMDPDRGYEDLVAVSSHELYHTWNIKRIRPVGMMPYDFSRENYTLLGYVAEGVTSYMGDLMLLRSGFYSIERYLVKLSNLLQRHFENPGRHNLSVADSSFDTWLDGYDREVPGRKVSIYNEGALIAFMLDVLIQEASDGFQRLDDVMRKLYAHYEDTGEGFTEEGLIQLVEEVSGTSFRKFFEDHVNGTKDYSRMLEHCFELLGIRWERIPKEGFHAAWLGFRYKKDGGYPMVYDLCPGSPAELAGIESGDRLIGVNGYEVNEESLPNWCAYFEDETIAFTLLRDGRILERSMEVVNEACFCDHRLRLKVEQGNEAFRNWKRSLIE